MIGEPENHQSTYFVDRYGHYVAWPIHSPRVPEYGECAFVALEFGPLGQVMNVHFIRQLDSHEINQIRRQYMVWGNLISGHGWALLMGKPNTFGDDGTYDVTYTSSGGRSVGV
jgi:hypothetical protein